MKRLSVLAMPLVFVVLLSVVSLPISARSAPVAPAGGRVLWDTYHGVRLGQEDCISSYYSGLASALESQGYVLEQSDAGITNIELGQYDVLVVTPICAWDSEYSSAEVSEIQSFVNGGGGLLIMADLPSDFTDNVRPVCLAFGTDCGVSHASPIEHFFSNFADHPIFYGVTRLYYAAPGTLIAASPSQAVAWDSSDLVMVTVAQYGEGRVVTLGDSLALGWDWHVVDNLAFGLNVFEWLSVGAGVTVEVKVVDENENPVNGAKVYLDGIEVPDSTGTDGTVLVDRVNVGDELVATYRKHEQPTNKDSHSQDSDQDWAYRVYLTSADVSNDGTVNAHAVASTAVPQTLTIKKRNTLIGFNIVASVEWDASGAYLDDLKRGFEKASKYLYDASDGQMLFERINIHDDKVDWAHADYQIKASNQEWPHAYVGAILDGSDKRAYFGRRFDGSTSNRGYWASSAAYRTLIHEFGHYGLHLYDERYYYGGFLGSSYVNTQCTLNRTMWGTTYSYSSVASSLMDSQFLTTEFCSTLVENPHNHDTHQHQKNGESCWQTIVRKYKDSQATPRWEIRAPTDPDRGQVVSGPTTIPVLDWMQTELKDGSTGTCANTLEYHVEDRWGNPSKATHIWLIKSGGRILYQGKTDVRGVIDILGASNGDTLTGWTKFNLYFNSGTVSCSASSNSAQVTDPTLATIPTPNQVVDTVSTTMVLQPAPFKVNISSVPGTSDNTLVVRVQASTALSASPQVLLLQSSASSPTTLSMSDDGGTGTYVGTATLDPNLGHAGIIEVTAVDINSESVHTFVNFKIESVAASEDATVHSGDGDARLYLPVGSLSQPTAITIVPSTEPNWPDNEDLVVVTGPYAIAAGEGVKLEQPAALSLRYHDDVDQAQNVDLATLKVHRWDTDASQWVEVGGVLNAEHHEVSTPIHSLSVYALIGERQFTLFLPVLLRDS